MDIHAKCSKRRGEFSTGVDILVNGLENGEGQTDVNELESNHIAFEWWCIARHCNRLSCFIEFACTPYCNECDQGHPELNTSLSERHARKPRTYSLISTACLLRFNLQNADPLSVLILNTREDCGVSNCPIWMLSQWTAATNMADLRMEKSNVDGRYQVDLHPCGSLTCCAPYSLWFPHNWRSVKTKQL